jgi:regulator of replication initiation timing
MNDETKFTREQALEWQCNQLIRELEEVKAELAAATDENERLTHLMKRAGFNVLKG